MYLTPHQKKQLRTIVVLLVGIPLTVFAVYQGIQYFTKAGIEATPKEVIASNITTNSLTISWITEKESDGYVVPILNGSEQNPVRDKRGSGRRYSHYVELKSLEPDTRYSFQIVSDGKKYSSSDGNNFEFTTASVSSETPIPNPIHGTVTGISGDDVVIYTLLKNKSAYPVSTIIPSGGNWIMDLSAFRKISDKTLITVTDDTELILVAKSNLNKGITVEGKYSALFDSNGKLNELYSLSITDATDLLTYFPEKSKLGVKLVAETPPSNNEGENKDPILPPNTGGSDEEEEEEEVPSDEYSIVHDLKWVDLVSGTSLGDLEYGEDTVVVTNLTDVGFTVVWRSQEKEEGYIKYGTSENSLNEESRDSRDGLTSRGEYYSHMVGIDRLTPDTTYYFEVYSGDNVLGDTFSVETLSTLNTPPPFDTKSGTLTGTEDLSDWILVAQLVDKNEVGTSGSSEYISTTPDENGNWILTVGDARSSSGSEYFTYSADDEIHIYILGKSEKLFDFKMTSSDIELDSSFLYIGGASEVKLLSDYGIVNI